MSRILQRNYFIGVFLSLLSSLYLPEEPILFEPMTENRNHIKLTTNPGSEFNIYLKYSRRLKNTVKDVAGKNKAKMSCQVDFLPSDYDYLRNRFPEQNKTNLICLICTDKGLSETRLVILEYKDAMKCLAKKNSRGIRTIRVKRTGENHSYSCTGVGFKNEQSITCPFNCKKYFGVERNNRCSA